MIRRYALALVLLGSAVAGAQQGVDFFEAPDEPFLQKLGYRFGIAYQPGGGIFVSPDGENQQAVIVASHSLQATLQLAYSLTPAWTLDAFGAAGISRTSQYQAAAASAVVDWQALFKAGAGVKHTFKGSFLEPALHFGISYPALRIESRFSASLIRDPVLIRGMIGLGAPLPEAGLDVLVEVAATFLANDAVIFGGSAALTVPLANTRFTQGEITFHTAYDYGQQAPAWLTTSISLKLGGNSIGLLVSADISGDKALQP